MDTLWSVYHDECPRFLRELARTPEMQRLREVGMNCGCEYTRFPRFVDLAPYSRFDHSLGVGLIVWHFTQDEAQAAAGLLHDVATPVFAHVVDFLNGDHARQESTEDRTEELIAGSASIQALLTARGLVTADVADYHRYPIADNDSPRLSADRLEYSLGNMVNYGFAEAEQARAFYENLAVGENEDGTPELVFRDLETAAAFTETALRCSRVYVADEDRFAMQALAELLRLALRRGVLARLDLHGTEADVIRMLEADPVCRAEWARFRAYHGLLRSDTPQDGWMQVDAKLRCIDPLVADRGRVSVLESRIGALLEDFRQTSFDCWLKGI